jgi:hypothetical protein
MNITFRARIVGGRLVVPQKHKEKLTGKKAVRVTISIETERRRSKKAYVDELFSKPLVVNNFKPMTRAEIYADR